MHLLSYIKDIRKNGSRCFTLADILTKFTISPSSARVALHRLLKTGDIISPMRGLYVIVPPEHQPHGSIPAQELIPLIMQYIHANYYVALLTAGLFYGATHQKPARFQVISDKRIKTPLVCGDIEIDFIYKKTITQVPTKNVAVSTGYLIIASPELIALDLLNYPNHAGGLNHTATVLAEIGEQLDAQKLIQLAEDTHSSHQLQRIGYILDHIETTNDDYTKQCVATLASYIAHHNPRYQALASELLTKTFPRCKKWKIIENTTVESDV